VEKGKSPLEGGEWVKISTLYMVMNKKENYFLT
jgi:hypothetical protein